MTFTKSRNLPSGVGVYLGMALHHWVLPPYFLEGRARDCAVAVLSRRAVSARWRTEHKSVGPVPGIGHLLARCELRCRRRRALLCYFRSEQPAIATKNKPLAENIRRALSRGHSCQHYSTRFCDSSAPIDSLGRTAAFMGRIIRSACFAGPRLNMT